MEKSPQPVEKVDTELVIHYKKGVQKETRKRAFRNLMWLGKLVTTSSYVPVPDSPLLVIEAVLTALSGLPAKLAGEDDGDFAHKTTVPRRTVKKVATSEEVDSQYDSCSSSSDESLSTE